MSTARRELDLLKAPITPALFTLALPIMLGALLQTCYTMTDMFWVGRLGDQPVAAVGTIGMVIWFTQGLLTAPKVGGQIYTGQQLGAGDLDEAREFCTASIRLTLFFSLVIGLLLLLFHRPILAVFALNEAGTQQAASDYLLICSFALPLSALPMMLSALMTASGNSRLPFAVTAAGLAANMILDPLLILVFRLGVSGAALATALSQLLQVLFYFFCCRRHPLFRALPILRLRFGRQSSLLLKLGIPSAILNVCFAGISIAVARIVADFGDLAIAAQRIGINVESISYAGAEGFSLALSSMLAQNFGARQFARSRRIYRTGYLLTVLFSCCTTAVLYFGGPFFSALFLSHPDAVRCGSDYLRIISYSQLFMNIEIIVIGAFSALGNTLIPSLTVILLMLLRIPLALTLSAGDLAISGIWWAVTLSTIAKGLLLTLFFALFKKRKLQTKEQEKRRIYVDPVLQDFAANGDLREEKFSLPPQ